MRAMEGDRSSSSSSSDAAEPLLPAASSTTQRHPHRGRRSHPHQQQQQQQPSVDLGGRFARRLWSLLCIIRAAPALSLVLLSLAETIIVSKIGAISGLFYQVFVDGQASAVPHLMLWSAGCYTATALFYSFKSGLQDFFAWRWRASLSVHLQKLYCANIGATCPKTRQPLLQSLDSPDQRVAQDLPLLTASLSEVVTQLAAVPFNIVWYTHLTRQVFGSWLPVLCAYVFFLLGLLLQRLVMLPVASAVFQQEAAEGAFRYGHTRFRAWAAEVALYRSEPIEQQHLEGQLSRVLICQGRLMLRRAVVTATSRLLEYGGLVVNFGCLAAAVFGGAWSGAGQSAGDIASKVSVASFYLLTLIYNFSQVLDLASKVANLAGLTARVSQMLEALSDTSSSSSSSSSSTSPHSTPQHTRKHSGGSGSSKWLRSHTAARTDVEKQASDQQQPHLADDQQQQQQPLQEVAAGRSPSHQRYASQAVLLQPPQLVLLPPAQQAATNTAADAAGAATASGVGGGDVMQVSIHSMGADVLLQEVRRAFPDSPRLAPLLAVVTFQFCGAARTHMHHRLRQQQQGGPLSHRAGQLLNNNSCSPCAAGAAGCGGCSSSSSDCGLCGDADMQHMLAVFMAWQQAVFAHITRSGYWCDTIDPRSGAALHSTPGSHYDEVIGASVLLGYDTAQVTPAGGSQQQQAFSLVSHPEAGTQVYPATLFTSAPLPVVREALRLAAGAQQVAGVVAASTADPGDAANAVQAAAGPSGGSSTASSTTSPGCRALSSPQSPSQQQQQQQQPPQPQTQTQTQTQTQPQQEVLLSCRHLSVSTPAGVPVVQGLSLEVCAGRPLLIQGPSGCGKSTLVRCLAGLWPADAGRASMAAAAAERSLYVAADGGRQGVSRGTGGVLFVPQRPLAAPGTTLRQQLLYPAAASLWPCMCRGAGGSSSLQQQQQQGWQPVAQPAKHQRPGQHTAAAAAHSGWWLNWLSCGLLQQQQHQSSQHQHHHGSCLACQQLLSVLDRVGLSYLLAPLPGGLHTHCEAWGDVLSPGELQRLAFARVLLHRPALVVLDEATSALPAAAAAELYRQLAAAGVWYVSVGHSSCLADVHQHVLSIAGDGQGGWRLA